MYDGFHDVSKRFIHSHEPPALLGHLGHDVGRAEDGLQVQPRGLDLEPLVQNLLQQQQLAFPFSEEQNTAALVNGSPSMVDDD